MSEFAHLKDVAAKFQDLSIHIHELHLQFLSTHELRLQYLAGRDKDMQLSANSSVWHGMVVHYKEQGRELVGDVTILFRHKTHDLVSHLLLLGVMSASSDVDNNPRSVFCKLIQYLFDWMHQYAKENQVRHTTGEVFVVPDFVYARDDFKNLPVD